MQISNEGMPSMFDNSFNLLFTCFHLSQASMMATNSSLISSDPIIIFKYFSAFSISLRTTEPRSNRIQDRNANASENRQLNLRSFAAKWFTRYARKNSLAF
ncbi:hypothetical protein NE237_023121 [Protea cynaroides]|uniref:Uncharacterized protein n=1 Tax=Protea cynaroides TaxID=273540 RepID=A0A9Q0K545_9MAGN|nr:hypothetical protein NE237_023121 [Protea cynaroides]